MKIIFLSLILSLLFSQSGAQNYNYLDKDRPTVKALIFAQGTISDQHQNRDITISQDGSEIYFRVIDSISKKAFISYTEFKNEVWSKPEKVSFCEDSRYNYLEPIFSPDGSKLYFVSDMPDCAGDSLKDDNIWYVNKLDDGWSAPVNIGLPVNTDGGEYFPSFTTSGHMYFTRNDKGVERSFIYKSEWRDGKFSTPVRLPEQINRGLDRFNAYVSPDESFVVVPAVGVEEGKRGAFYYIVFRNSNGTWENPINMGSEFNSAVGRGWSFYISPDLKYAFFMATFDQSKNSDIYWISTDVIKSIAGKYGKVVLE